MRFWIPLFCLACSEYDLKPERDDNTLPEDSAITADPIDTANPDLDLGECGELELPPAISVALNTECEVNIQQGSFTPVIEWNLNGYNAYGPPVVGQLNDDNGDGNINAQDVPDIVYSTIYGGGLVSVNGQTGQIQWVSNAVSNGFSGQAIGDVDGDGIPEIAAANGPTRVVLMDNTGAQIWAADAGSMPLTYFMYPSIADMDNDGLAEIIIGSAIFNHDGTLAGKGPHGVGGCPNQSTYNAEGSISIPVDIDGDGQLEIVVGNAAYEKDGSVVWYNGTADGIPAVADMDLDGQPEIVVISGNSAWTLETDGTPTGWSTSFPNTNYLGPPAIDDLDGDGQPDFVLVGSGEMRAYRWDGSVIWTQTVQDMSGAAGPILFDFELDGYPEVVYADETTVRIFNGLDGSVKLMSNEHQSTTGFENPIVADVDADGQVEIVMTHAHGSPGLSVYGDANQSWPQGRQIWNQHAYSITNINDDLSLPAPQQPNWQQYNNFRSADGGPPPNKWIDLQPEIIDTCFDECPDRLFLSVRVLNRGTYPIEPGLKVLVKAGPSGGIVAVGSVPTAIPSGKSSEAIAIEVDGSSLNGQPAVVVIDPQAPAIINFGECDGTNNIEAVGACPE